MNIILVVLGATLGLIGLAGYVTASSLHSTSKWKHQLGPLATVIPLVVTLLGGFCMGVGLQ